MLTWSIFAGLVIYVDMHVTVMVTYTLICMLTVMVTATNFDLFNTIDLYIITHKNTSKFLPIDKSGFTVAIVCYISSRTRYGSVNAKHLQKHHILMCHFG